MFYRFYIIACICKWNFTGTYLSPIFLRLTFNCPVFSSRAFRQRHNKTALDKSIKPFATWVFATHFFGRCRGVKVCEQLCARLLHQLLVFRLQTSHLFPAEPKDEERKCRSRNGEDKCAVGKRNLYNIMWSNCHAHSMGQQCTTMVQCWTSMGHTASRRFKKHHLDRKTSPHCERVSHEEASLYGMRYP